MNRYMNKALSKPCQVEVEVQESFQERLYVEQAIYLLDRRKAIQERERKWI